MKIVFFYILGGKKRDKHNKSKNEIKIEFFFVCLFQMLQMQSINELLIGCILSIYLILNLKLRLELNLTNHRINFIKKNKMSLFGNDDHLGADLMIN